MKRKREANLETPQTVNRPGTPVRAIYTPEMLIEILRNNMAATIGLMSNTDPAIQDLIHDALKQQIRTIKEVFRTPPVTPATVELPVETNVVILPIPPQLDLENQPFDEPEDDQPEPVNLPEQAPVENPAVEMSGEEEDPEAKRRRTIVPTEKKTRFFKPETVALRNITNVIKDEAKSEVKNLMEEGMEYQKTQSISKVRYHNNGSCTLKIVSKTKFVPTVEESDDNNDKPHRIKTRSQGPLVCKRFFDIPHSPDSEDSQDDVQNNRGFDNN